MFRLVLVLSILFVGIHFALSEDRNEPGREGPSTSGAGALNQLILEAENAGLEYFGPDLLYPEFKRYKQKTLLPADFVELEMEQLPTYELQEVRKQETHRLDVKIVVRHQGVIDALLPFKKQKHRGGLHEAFANVGVRNDNIAIFFFVFRGNQINFNYLTYIERDRGNYFVWLPFYDPEEQETYIAQIWVSHVDADFDLQITQQHLLAMYNVFVMPRDSNLPQSLISDLRNPAYGEPNTINTVSHILAVSWTPNACAALFAKKRWLIEEECNNNKWAIHGLWPQKPTLAANLYRLRFCLAPGARPAENMVSLERIPNEFYNDWSYIGKHRSLEEHLDFEWCKHGYNVKGIQDIQHYFHTSTVLFQRLQLQQSLTGSARDGDDFSFHHFSTIANYFSDVFPNHMSRGTRQLPDFVCELEFTGHSRINEIHFCYDKQFNPINCEGTHFHSCRDAPNIMQPRSFHLFPNFVLTLKNSETVDGAALNKKWKIQSFCPTRRYNGLIELYNKIQNIHLLSMDLQLILSLGDEYQQFMVNVSNTFTNKNQSDLWSECGALTYSAKSLPEIVNTPADYLRLAMTLYSALNTDQWLTESVIRVTRQWFPFSLSKRGLFICQQSNDGRVLLEEIRICYATDGEMIDCSNFDLYHSFNPESSDLIDCPDYFFV